MRAARAFLNGQDGLARRSLSEKAQLGASAGCGAPLCLLGARRPAGTRDLAEGAELRRGRCAGRAAVGALARGEPPAPCAPVRRCGCCSPAPRTR